MNQIHGNYQLRIRASRNWRRDLVVWRNGTVVRRTSVEQSLLDHCKCATWAFILLFQHAMHADLKLWQLEVTNNVLSFYNCFVFFFISNNPYLFTW